MAAFFSTALLATIHKEIVLLRRDIHGLLLLFVMPILFILIMSLALQNQFAKDGGSKIKVLIEDHVNNQQSAAVLDNLRSRTAFDWQLLDVSTEEERGAIQKKISDDEAAFGVQIRLHNGTLIAEVVVAPATSPQIEAILTATVSEAITRQRIEVLLFRIQSANLYSVEAVTDEEKAFHSDPVQITYGYKKSAMHGESRAPNSVQQSVPAWLVFAMFFAVVPLSNALINERQQGTLRRLRTMHVSPFLPIFGKLIPYFFINQMQVLLMLAVGVYVMPCFGADSLELGDSLAGLVVIAVALSIAALGYGIFIAVVARTTDQATILGAAGNIILAAIGGIMVPRFVMPEMMQQVSQWSPMAWGLEGFLDILLRNGGVADVFPEAGALLFFGCVMMAFSLILSKRKF